MRIPTEISGIFSDEPERGTFEVKLVFTIPEEFNKNFYSALEVATKEYLRHR